MVIPAPKLKNWPWLFPSRANSKYATFDWSATPNYTSAYPGTEQQWPASQYAPPTPSTGQGTGRARYRPSLANRAADRATGRPAVVQQADPNVPPGIMPYLMMQWAGQQISKYRNTQQWAQYQQELRDYVNDETEFDQPVTPGTQSDTTGGGGGGGGGGGTQYTPAPSGVDPEWYQQFQQEHGGQTPEEYYAQTGEDIGHAMADEEWGQEFYEANGRPPNDYEWRWHWFMTRTGHPPPEGMERWLQEQEEGFGTEESTQRPPTYEPPMIIWR